MVSVECIGFLDELLLSFSYTHDNTKSPSCFRSVGPAQTYSHGGRITFFFCRLDLDTEQSYTNYAKL